MTKDEDNFLKYLLSTTLIIGIVGCLIYIGDLVTQKKHIQDNLTQCEKMCYPSEVSEQAHNNRCICEPEIHSKD